MRYASYLKDGQPTFGALVDGGLVSLAGRLEGIATLRQAIAAGRLADLSDLAARSKPDADPEAVTFLVPLPDAAKILCIGKNYEDHVAEGGGQAKPWPGWFVRMHDSLVPHGASLEAPRPSEQFDFEGELALVIGRGGRDIAEADAMAHVAGWTCFMDGSVRDFQKRNIASGKNFHASGAWGPWFVTADEVGDPTRLRLSTFVNGERMQHAGLDELIHPIPRCIAYLSTIVALEPGDVIATGTPAGVGQARTPPRWLRLGDRVTVEIPGVGTLSNVVAERG